MIHVLLAAHLMNTAPINLRCEYLTNPLGVAESRPHLYWELSDGRYGAKQTAYQIVVAGDPTLLPDRPDLWDSGKVASDATIHIEYAGKPLTSGQFCYWQVRSWDQDGQPGLWSETAHWSVGMLHPEDWKAKWIENATPVQDFVPSRNGFHSQLADSPDTIKTVSIEMSGAQDFDRIKLFPARPYDFPDTPGFLFPVRYMVEIYSRQDATDTIVVASFTQSDQERPGDGPVEIALEPTRARCIRLTVTKMREREPGKYGFALAEVQVLNESKVLSQGATVIASDSIENRDWSTRYLTDGDILSHGSKGSEPLPAPMFRKQFQAAKAIKRAIATVSALGVYEVTINGLVVGDHRLAPEWTDYNLRVQYQTYDVTKLMRQGENNIVATVADGWYAGRLGMAQGLTDDGRPRAVYGRKPAFLMQTDIQYDDGSSETVVTDDSWQATVDGPVRIADLLDGETYDATKVNPEGWKPVAIKKDGKAELVWQPNEPIRQTLTVKAVALTEPKPGVYVYDMGQNMPGHCKLTVRDVKSEVTLRHAEMLNDDGTIYTTNLRGAPQIDHYIPNGAASETFEPRFTYHGFRYVEVTGLSYKPKLEDLVGIVVNSSSPIVSEFDCSDPMLNRLWQNILWTQRANLMSVPTDCPQRDERLGWMGDILAFAQNACFNMDLAAFYTKWFQDVRDAQADDGRYGDFSPNPYGKNKKFNGVPAWGDAGVFVPWVAYENYADTRLIERHFDSMRRWIDWIDSKNPNHLWQKERHNDYNDWLNGDSLIQKDWPRTGGSIPNEVFATAFFARSTYYVAQMAKVLGGLRSVEAEKYEKLYEEIKSVFNKAYVKEDGTILGDTQAGYALALNFDLLPKEMQAKAFDKMIAALAKYNNHISTGFHSTHRMMMELTERGRNDIAYQVALNKTFPSWGYSIENGATTIWERWDGYVKGRGFQDPGMNSFNHWALGSVGEWMMRTIIGINPDPASPGYKHFILRPLPGGGLSSARGSYHSIHGTISVSWKIADNRTTFDITVPPNTTATLFLPVGDPAKIEVKGDASHARFAKTDGAACSAELAAGSYQFTIPK